MEITLSISDTETAFQKKPFVLCIAKNYLPRVLRGLDGPSPPTSTWEMSQEQEVLIIHASGPWPDSWKKRRTSKDSYKASPTAGLVCTLPLRRNSNEMWICLDLSSAAALQWLTSETPIISHLSQGTIMVLRSLWESTECPASQESVTRKMRDTAAPAGCHLLILLDFGVVID